MNASEIMTRNVVTVGPQTPVREVAETMSKHRISGVPVVDDGGRLVGILSESDLLHRMETGTERRRKWWLGMFQDTSKMAQEFTKSHGLTAGEIMTANVTTVNGTSTLADIAELLDAKKLKRVPVIVDGKLAGIITRGDLVKVLANADAKPKAAAGDDGTISRAVTQRIGEVKWLHDAYVSVLVMDGIAELTGMVPTAEQKKALIVLVEETPGVKGIEDRLHVGRLNLQA
ncbi:MAG: CBS domain-containing protein [Hyphomicrobiaceae bacterium]